MTSVESARHFLTEKPEKPQERYSAVQDEELRARLLQADAVIAGNQKLVLSPFDIQQRKMIRLFHLYTAHQYVPFVKKVEEYGVVTPREIRKEKGSPRHEYTVEHLLALVAVNWAFGVVKNYNLIGREDVEAAAKKAKEALGEDPLAQVIVVPTSK